MKTTRVRQHKRRTRSGTTGVVKHQRNSNDDNSIVQNIAIEIGARELKMAGFQLVKMDKNTLRVHKGKKNLDIRYNYGADLYDLKYHTIKPDYTVDTYEKLRLFNEDLKGEISQFFNFEYVGRLDVQFDD